MNAKFISVAVAMTFSAGAMAGPVIALPEGPLFIKFENREQIGLNGATTYEGTDEFNWGVLRVSTIEIGDVVADNDQIGGSGDFFFINNNATGGFSQITGIFYDIAPYTGTDALSPFPATGGYLDLYWRDVATYGVGGILSADFDSAKRTAQDKYTGFTEGTLLARIMFADGIDAAGVTISGTVIPTTGLFNGIAESYGNVDTSVVGAWSEALDGDWFNTPYGTRDLRFKNSYSNLAAWDGADAVCVVDGQPSPCILGAKSDDPAQAYAVPEPATLALLGMGLLGMGAVARRRKV